MGRKDDEIMEKTQAVAKVIRVLKEEMGILFSKTMARDIALRVVKELGYADTKDEGQKRAGKTAGKGNDDTGGHSFGGYRHDESKAKRNSGRGRMPSTLAHPR